MASVGFPLPAVPLAILPALTTAHRRRMERLLVREYGLGLMPILENIGRHLADLALLWLDGSLARRRVLVLAGRGQHGGGGLAAARHLANRGAEVQVVIARPVPSGTGPAARQLRLLWRMGVSVTEAEPGWDLPGADLILDTLIGRARPSPGPETALLHLAQSHPAPILALDIPSGLDGETGTVEEPCLRAVATLVPALPLTGLLRAPAAVVGELFLADSGVPMALYESLGLSVPPVFAQGALVRLSR
jgi:NAD(P)H-hydrate epimerase